MPVQSVMRVCVCVCVCVCVQHRCRPADLISPCSWMATP